MTLKNSVSDYTEKEFVRLFQRIIGNDASEEEETNLFITSTPFVGILLAGSGFDFYPEDGADDSPKALPKRSKHGVQPSACRASKRFEAQPGAAFDTTRFLCIPR